MYFSHAQQRTGFSLFLLLRTEGGVGAPPGASRWTAANGGAAAVLRGGHTGGCRGAPA